jgi:HlyD family secretion protein
VNTDPNNSGQPLRSPLQQRKSKRRRNITIAATCITLIVACAWGGGRVLGLWDDGAEFDEGKWHEVIRGPLTISLRRTGTIHHRDKVVIKSKLEGYSTVIWLIDEGTQVKTGDLLLQMDPTKFVQKKEAQDIIVIRRQADLIGARETLEVVKNASRTVVDGTKLAIELAELDLKKYLGGDLKDYSKVDPNADDEGDYPQLFQQAQGAIAIANEEIKRAEDRVAWSTRLADAGYLTSTELEADQLAAKKAKLSLAAKKSELALLKEYSYPRKVAELQNRLAQSKRRLKPLEAIKASEVQVAAAGLAAAQSQYDQQVALAKKYAQQINECRVLAPVSGQVVYATTTSRRFRDKSEVLRKGAGVRERQELFHMPNADQKMMAVIQVPQACEPMLIDQADGTLLKLPCRVTIAGTRDKYFAATLTKIDPLPYHEWIQSIKVFNAEVHFDEICPDLRPGYTCKVELIIDQYENVLSVPLQTVQLVRGKPTVYVSTPTGPKPRTVETGMDNNRLVHVRSGLKEGERVLLAPPFDETQTEASEQDRAQSKAKNATTKPASD